MATFSNTALNSIIMTVAQYQFILRIHSANPDTSITGQSIPYSQITSRGIIHPTINAGSTKDYTGAATGIIRFTGLNPVDFGTNDSGAAITIKFITFNRVGETGDPATGTYWISAPVGGADGIEVVNGAAISIPAVNMPRFTLTNVS